MKKKIKNSNFMNLLWFIIAILPILIFGIYTLSFLNDDEKEITQSYEFENILSYSDSDTYTYLTNNDNILNYEANASTSDPRVRLVNFDLSSGSYRLYISSDVDLLSSITLRGFAGTQSISYSFSDTYSYIDFDLSDDTNSYFYFIFRLSAYDTTINFYTFLTDNLDYTLTQDDIRNSDNLEITKVVTYNLYNNYEDFLTMYQLSWFGSGFVANMFITLLSYFSVTSVYAYLLCYYLEYLVLTMLLHLAFDFIMLIPNICHKFMDKIGGERE